MFTLSVILINEVSDDQFHLYYSSVTLPVCISEYEIDQAEAGELTPRWPGLQGSLYESQFSCQFFMVSACVCVRV